VCLNWSISVDWAVSDVVNEGTSLAEVAVLGFTGFGFVASSTITSLGLEVQNVERLWGIVLLDSLQSHSSVSFSLSQLNWLAIGTNVSGGLGVSFGINLLRLVSVNVGMDRDSLDSSDEAEDCERKGLLHFS
jgi:hypothetical protein